MQTNATEAGALVRFWKWILIIFAVVHMFANEISISLLVFVQALKHNPSLYQNHKKGIFRL